MEVEINSSFVAGIISTIFLLLILAIGIFVVFGLGDIIMIIGFGYVSYKTLWQKQKLSNWEWVGFSILVIWLLISFMIGFAIGFAGY